MSTPSVERQKRRPLSRMNGTADFVSNHDDYRVDPIWTRYRSTRLALATLRQAMVLGLVSGFSASVAMWVLILAGGVR